MNDQAISILNNLIMICEDGEKGFRKVSEEITEQELKTLFNSCAEGCNQAIDELQKKVLELGGVPEKSGSLIGAAHRVWIDIKAAIIGKDTLGILEECERGEDVAKDAYKRALQEELSEEIYNLIQKQYEGVKKNHDLVRDIRNKYRSAKNNS